MRQVRGRVRRAGQAGPPPARPVSGHNPTPTTHTRSGQGGYSRGCGRAIRRRWTIGRTKKGPEREGDKGAGGGSGGGLMLKLSILWPMSHQASSGRAGARWEQCHPTAKRDTATIITRAGRLVIITHPSVGCQRVDYSLSHMWCSTRKRKIKAWSAQVPDQRRTAS